MSPRVQRVEEGPHFALQAGVGVHHLRFWSPDALRFTSENDELESVFDIFIGATGGRGIFICDMGGDNIGFFRYFLRKNVDFIVQLKNSYSTY